ncbi:MAG: hypothetical protein JJU33_05585 [Phycisphaerales bacterium]|nr:hypothetical protein [Phycisphaerales bacterium]
MSSIGIQFDCKPWAVRIPQLIRYMERRYVDEFFSTGRLRLSSWRGCWEAEDVERCDWSEGRYEGMIGNCATVAFMPSACLLCASAIESAEMAQIFQADAGIRVVRPLEFAHAIARQLTESDVGFEGGEFGSCTYRDGKFNHRNAAMPNDLSRPKEIMNAISRSVSQVVSEASFVKDVKFSSQAEWRFVWRVQRLESKHLVIECPEAAVHCEAAAF